MRVARALAVLPTLLTLALVVVVGTLVARKTVPAHFSEIRAKQVLAGAAAFVVLALAAVVARRLAPRAGTIALDRHHGLSDRLTNALTFAALPVEKRTALMDIAIDDACEHADRLSPAKAAPLPVPGDMAISVLVALGVGLVWMLEVRTPIPPAPKAPTIDALSMPPDDIELFRDAAKQLTHENQGEDMKAAVERFNQLIEDLANKRLDRAEAFRRMEAIQRELLSNAEADKKALEEALKQMSEELKKSELTKPLGESLEKKDLEKAKKDLKALSDALRDKKKKPDKQALERLKNALARAASKKKEALAALNEKRAEIREQLLMKKKQQENGAPPSKEEERLLKKKERELERLDREAQQRERVQRQLDRLDRDLAKAAEDLMRDLGMSAQDLEQAAEDINRMQEEQLTDKEKEELRQRLEELRELLRQQGKGGKQRMSRLLKFGKRARGGAGKGGKPGQPGEQGEEDGDDGKGEGKDGKGKDGEGKQWVLGPGGKRIPIPGGGGSRSGGGDPGGSGNSGSGQEGGQQGGQGIGSSHDPNVAGKRTDMKSGTTDVQAAGLDSQQGPSNSKTILIAAERGFRGDGYKKVYTNYRTVAEQQINKDQVPDGYRFYVQRYFQLIRPRE
jgi:hypothetical protein